MEDPILKVENLKVWYQIREGLQKHFVKAVDDVSFEIKKGKTLGLVGESGSGKSTIGRAIVRLAPIKSGSISLEGKNITELGERDFKPIRKRIQMIFQDPNHTLNPRLTIGSILDEPQKIHFSNTTKSGRIDRSVELLEQVGLGSWAMQRYPHQLSGGQRQRVGIARAISVEPEIVICDEAVSALDVSVQAQIVNLLQDLQDQYHFAYLFIGHDLAVIEHISDWVLVMHAGKIVEQGDPDMIYSHAQNPYTKKLLDAVPQLPSLA
jgi:ABC-type oligopeptide transport system ATPase subunit